MLLLEVKDLLGSNQTLTLNSCLTLVPVDEMIGTALRKLGPGLKLDQLRIVPYYSLVLCGLSIFILISIIKVIIRLGQLAFRDVLLLS